MLKVREYLNSKFKSGENFILENGTGVMGNWVYPKNFVEEEYDSKNPYTRTSPIKDRIDITINNETIQFRMIIIGGQSCSLYGYLQTYEHLPRETPDANGYYQRSTDDEIINYIEGYVQKYRRYHKLDRRDKLNKIFKK